MVTSPKRMCLWPSVPSLRSSSPIFGKYLSVFLDILAFAQLPFFVCRDLSPFISFLKLFDFLYLMRWSPIRTPGMLQTGAHLLWDLQKRSNHRLVDRGMEWGRGLGIQYGETVGEKWKWALDWTPGWFLRIVAQREFILIHQLGTFNSKHLGMVRFMGNVLQPYHFTHRCALWRDSSSLWHSACDSSHEVWLCVCQAVLFWLLYLQAILETRRTQEEIIAFGMMRMPTVAIKTLKLFVKYL